VRSLAGAAEGFAHGEPDAPLPTSGVAEVRQMAEAFSEMRVALAARLRDLEAANAELQDRQDRLAVLQGELIQRDRLAAAGTLLAQLAHEIRNPVANVRNCLEVLRRRASDDPEAREFADMAIDELLRMHELTEQMMDLHRPKDPDTRCDAEAVAREVATLTLAGEPLGSSVQVEVSANGPTQVGISADRLKQVLLNLTRNAAEAMGHSGTVEIHVDGGLDSVVVRVEDDGPGIDEAVLPRVFDPFFTTKDEIQGVGLGLFTAEGLVRTYGGRISAINRADRSGACFRVEIPTPKPAETPDPSPVPAP
jgi:signal transduction histidine kinase